MWLWMAVNAKTSFPSIKPVLLKSNKPLCLFVCVFPNIQDYRSFGSIPMQPQQWKQNFAAFLSSNFPSVKTLFDLKPFPVLLPLLIFPKEFMTSVCAQPATSCSKRRHESESTLQKTKKLRSNSEQTRQASDMEIESGTQL